MRGDETGAGVTRPRRFSLAKHMPMNFYAVAMDSRHGKAGAMAETVKKSEHRALRRVRRMEQVRTIGQGEDRVMAPPVKIDRRQGQMTMCASARLD